MAGRGVRAIFQRSNWWEVTRLVDRDRWRVGLLSLASFASGAAEAAFLVVLTRVGLAVADGADRTGVFNGWRLSVPTALVLAAALLVVRMGSSIAGAVLTASLAARVTLRIRSQLTHAFLAAPWSVQQAEPSGRLQQLIGAVASTAASTVSSFGGTISAALSLLALMLLAVMVDPLGTVLVLVALVVLGAMLAPIRRRIKLRARFAAVASMTLSTQVAEIGQLGIELHAFGVHRQVDDLLERAMTKETLARRRAGVLSAVLPTAYISMAFGALLVGVAIASAVGVDELSSVGAVLLMMLRSLSYGQQLQAASGNLAMAIPSLEQIDHALAAYQSVATVARTESPSSVTPVEIDDVSYAYDGVNNAVAGVTLRVERGEVVGIIGPSGAGKSTLVQLVLGLRAPTTGTIRAGGADVGRIAPDMWSRRVAFVPQEAHLLTGTVIDNVRFFRDDISIDDVRRALSLAGLIDDVEQLQDGLDTSLGERGSSLSGGQRQRLSIARALAGRPELLVLDEPTSALDMRSESIIRDTLHSLKGEVTVIVIAHRMSTLEACDRLAVVENGCLTEQGTPAQLLGSSDFYRRAVSPTA